MWTGLHMFIFELKFDGDFSIRIACLWPFALDQFLGPTGRIQDMSRMESLNGLRIGNEMDGRIQVEDELRTSRFGKDWKQQLGEWDESNGPG
jgi:hypothetical protein